MRNHFGMVGVFAESRRLLLQKQPRPRKMVSTKTLMLCFYNEGVINMRGIYIHIPFCVRKCNYCDFASYPSKRELEDRYIGSLVEDISLRKGTNADTVYIGGGTPSVLSCDNMERLLNCIRENFDLSPYTEFTVEVNPGTVTLEKARLLKKYGVNRISMGAQSFVNSELKLLGRIHTAEDTEYTYNLLRNEGFGNISLDLMYGYPTQTRDTLEYSLNRLIGLNPEHISCYGLTIEEGTPFFTMREHGDITDCNEDTFADMYEYIRTRLASEGFRHYEISNFSKEGRESRHNLKYWQGDDYLGFGVAAASKEGSRRYTYTSDIEEYLSNRILTEDYTMSLEEQMSEFVILGLRVINSGVDKQKFRELFKVDFDSVFSDAKNSVSSYVIDDKNALKLRNEAALVSNSIMCRFVLDK